MKKYISILLIVLVAITCFVSCDHEVSETAGSYVAKITVTNSNHDELPDGDYYIKSADDCDDPTDDPAYHAYYNDPTCTTNMQFGLFQFQTYANGNLKIFGPDDMSTEQFNYTGFTADNALGTVSIKAGYYSLPALTYDSFSATIELYVAKDTTFYADKNN